MRILIAVHNYPPHYNGGAERRAARTARSLLARGHMVRVLAMESLLAPEMAAYSEDDVHAGVPVRRLHIPRVVGRDAFRWSYDNPQIEAFFIDMMREWQPDIVHLFSGYLTSASVVRAAHASGVPI